MTCSSIWRDTCRLTGSSPFFMAMNEEGTIPHKAPTPCKYPRCPGITQEVYCAKHQNQTEHHYEKVRGSAASRGYGYRWQKYRKQFLAENPLCINFKECHHVAVLVDHKRPSRGDSPLFWDPDNHQAMCKACHDTKTATEDGGFGNPRRIINVRC